MKKGKSRNKRKKTRSRLLWIAIAVIGIAAVISAVCVAGMLATKENAWKTPEELLVEYMDHIPKQEYEEMYAMLHIEASGNVSQEDFVTRNSAIYEGIEVQNIAVQIIAYDEEQMTVTYQTSFDTVAGTISFENKALLPFGYPSVDKVRICYPCNRSFHREVIFRCLRNATSRINTAF